MSQATLVSTEHWFYHMESASLKAVLPELLEKTLERGWTALVKTSQENLAELDGFLWTYRDEAFLPHGREDEPLADQHPIRLSATATTPDGADIVFITDGSDMADLSGVSRLIYMINGQSDAAVTQARKRWSETKASGAVMSYWQQDGHDKWTKKATS